MNNRREFLKLSALASAAFMMPEFLKASGRLILPGQGKGKVLVVVQLSGGNDWLNTLVPFRNDEYYKARPSIGLQQNELIKITDNAAFNNNLAALAELYDNGNLAVINSVGYDNPVLSHFRSMDIWHGATDSDAYSSTGWLGRFLDQTCSSECANPHTAIEIDDSLSLAMKGEKMKAIACSSPDILNRSAQNSISRSVANMQHAEEHSHPNATFLHKTLVETLQSTDYIYAKSKIFKSATVYPYHEFGNRMKTIAELIVSGSETQVYYISLGSFDTHALQKFSQNRLLKIYSDTLKAFCYDLKMNKRFDDTMILTFSEFGRRVAQNAGKGTDHGTAGNVFIAGGKLASSGILNPLHDLENLTDGNLKHTIDFRQVYATLLENWLGAPSEQILGRVFEKMAFA